LAALQDVPETYYEAAVIDGAGPWAKFRHVTLPLISPVILFETIIAGIFTLQYFTQAFLLGQTRLNAASGGPENSLLVYGLYLFPFVVVLTTSFKPADEIFKLPPSLGSDRWTLDNYRAALDAMPFGRYLFNTALISSITVVGQLLSSSIVAYSLAKIRWRGRDALLLLIVATMMLPPQVTMISVYIAWSKLGSTWAYLPFPIQQ